MKELKRSFALCFTLILICAFVPSIWAQDVKSDVQTININKASAEELMELKRIGPKYAASIIQFRKDHGPFEVVEDITKIKGIGPKTLEANKGRIVVE